MAQPKTKRCPKCDREIDFSSKMCPFVGRMGCGSAGMGGIIPFSFRLSVTVDMRLREVAALRVGAALYD